MGDEKETELLLQTGTATCRRWRERRPIESRSTPTLGATRPRATLVDMSLSHTPHLPVDIQRLADDYFDLMHHQDMTVFDRVFHPDSVLYGVVEGELNIRPCAVYCEAMMARQSPAELGNPRRDSILAFDQISPTLALLKMQLEMFGGVMQDYLNLSSLDGQWWVVAKMWEKVGESAP